MPHHIEYPRIYLIQLAIFKLNHHLLRAYAGGARTPCVTTTLPLEGLPVLHAHCLLVYSCSNSAYIATYVSATRTHIMHSCPSGTLRVGRMVNMFVITYKRKRVGRKYQGTVLFLKMLQHNVMPERVQNFYVCAAISETSVKYVRVQDLCTLLAEVEPRTVSPNMVNLVPIAHAFPVSWVVS